MEDEWGPWIVSTQSMPQDGVHILAHLVEQKTHKTLRYEEGVALNGFFHPYGAEGEVNWSVYVFRYRIRKPRGLTVLEEIVEGVRQPENA